MAEFLAYILARKAWPTPLLLVAFPDLGENLACWIPASECALTWDVEGIDYPDLGLGWCSIDLPEWLADDRLRFEAKSLAEAKRLAKLEEDALKETQRKKHVSKIKGVRKQRPAAFFPQGKLDL